MSCVEAPGKFVVLNIADAASVFWMPNVMDGTIVWFCNHTSACTIDPPNCTLCLPLNHVAVSSMTFVDASRDEFDDVPVPFAVTPLAMFVRLKPLPQQAVSKRRR